MAKKLLYFNEFFSVRFIYCAAFILSLSFCAKAQEMSVRVFTVKDGLPSIFAWTAYQDKLGYLWVGSPYGLSRFDGKSFTNYGLADGLLDSRTASGFMDSRFRYWAATESGVVEFKGNRFVSYPVSDSQHINWICQVLETKKGEVWALTDKGIYQFNVNKWQKIKLYRAIDSIAYNIVESSDGLYINYGDLVVLKKPDGTFKMIGKPKPPRYYNTFTMSAGQIFISTQDGIYEIKDQQLVGLPGPLGRLKGNYVYFFDSKKRFWIGRYKIGIEVTTLGDPTHLVPVIKPSIDFLPQAISEDNLGNIWVGSQNGLIRISEPGFKIFDPQAIAGETILRNVVQPPRGPLFINDGSMTLHSFENGVFAHKKLLNANGTSLPNNELIIDDYAFDDKGRCWYSIRGFALAMQDGDKVYEQSKQLARLGDEVFDVEFDNYRKKILVAVRTQKFPCQFNDTAYSVLPVANNIVVKGNIMALHQCRNSTILFATDSGLIYSIDKQNICRLQLHEFNTPGRGSRFYNDPSGDVWIIYNGRGLRRYSWQRDSLVFKDELTKANGLVSDNVNTLCFDDSNKLWVNASSTVAVFSKRNDNSNNNGYQLVCFFNAEDLQMDGTVDARMAKDSKGDIWLLSSRHLICFHPDQINYNPPVPSMEIESIELNLRQTNWSDYADSLCGIFELPYHLVLSHENNTLGFNFKGISTSGTGQIKYSYLLAGLENLWSTPSPNDFVSFTKLPPGKYIFQVKAQFPNTNWSVPAIFSFEIKKAFWQTWWFSSFVFLFFSTCIYLFFRSRFMQKIKLLELRNRISQDLHDEIGASLSGINLLSQMAAEKLYGNKTEEAAGYLFKVKNYTQDVIEKLSDMVWIFNPQNDSIEKLLQRLKSFATSIALSKNIKMHFETGKESEGMNLSIDQRKAIYLISKEAINNSLKYAACSNIYYSLIANGSKWQLKIKDDGTGFIPSENKDGNGLKNMQARASEIGANFFIQSQTGRGTIITVEV